MTSQGTAHARFQRALDRRNVRQAEMAAREMGGLHLADALLLTLLIGDAAPARFERAAVRWHGRFELEARDVTLADAQLALAALGALRGPHADAAARTLIDVGRTYGMRLRWPSFASGT